MMLRWNKDRIYCKGGAGFCRQVVEAFMQMKHMILYEIWWSKTKIISVCRSLQLVLTDKINAKAKLYILEIWNNKYMIFFCDIDSFLNPKSKKVFSQIFTILSFFNRKKWICSKWIKEPRIASIFYTSLPFKTKTLFDNF